MNTFDELLTPYREYEARRKTEEAFSAYVHDPEVLYDNTELPASTAQLTSLTRTELNHYITFLNNLYTKAAQTTVLDSYGRVLGVPYKRLKKHGDGHVITLLRDLELFEELLKIKDNVIITDGNLQQARYNIATFYGCSIQQQFDLAWTIKHGKHVIIVMFDPKFRTSIARDIGTTNITSLATEHTKTIDRMMRKYTPNKPQ